MKLVDQCYEAAFVPERWEQALGGLCALSRAGQASMIFFDRHAPPASIGFNLPVERVEAFQQVWRESEAVRWGLAARPIGFTTFRENLPADVLAADRAVGILHEQGLDDHAISVQSLGEGRHLGLMFARRGVDGRFDRAALAALDAMRPHLVRAGLVAVRLSLERARSSVEALARLGLAAAVIGAGRRVIAANPLLETMTAVVQPTAFGGIAIADRFADDRLREALDRATADRIGTRLSIPIPATDRAEPMIVHLVPVRGEVQDIFADARALLVVAPVGRRGAPDPALLQGLFDLTPAEARLTGALLAGGTLKEIAAETMLSHHTLRSQLRAVMSKTGTRRQAELTQMLASL